LLQNEVILKGGNATSQYTWNTGGTSAQESITQNGTYSMTRTNFCYTENYSIKVNFIKQTDLQATANVFTPNGDGVNDTWQPINEPVDEYELRVYSRWGGLVFKTTNYTEAWGASNTADGIYFYSIGYKNCLNEPQQAKGMVQVMR